MSNKDRFVAARGETEDGKPSVMMVSQDAEGRRAPGKFEWHLSIIVEARDVDAVGLPSKDEQQVLNQVADVFQKHIVDPGNAIWLARNTFDGVRQFIYRVTDPEIPHKYLQGVIESGDHLRPFDYEMSNDPSWDEAEWMLAIARSEPDIVAESIEDLKKKLD